MERPVKCFDYTYVAKERSLKKYKTYLNTFERPRLLFACECNAFPCLLEQKFFTILIPAVSLIIPGGKFIPKMCIRMHSTTPYP